MTTSKKSQWVGKRIGIFKRLRNILWACWKRRRWDCVVIHRRKLVKNPPSLILPLLCGHVKGKLTCPPELTILMVHDYENPPIMEQSLVYTGIKNYVALKPKLNRPWYHSIKLVTILNYLNSGACKTEYILFADSDDAVLRDDPRKAIQYLEEENCDLLFSNTKFRGGYECMPEVKDWAGQVAKEKGALGLYLNSGVYIGRTAFFREVVEAAAAYVTDDDLSREEYGRRRRDGTLGERLPEFPKACGSDQAIFRFLHQRFYPRLKVDYLGRLALR